MQHRTLLNPAEAWWDHHAFRDDRSVQAVLQAEARAGRHPRSVYELYAEMEEKDGHYFSLLQTRLNGLLALPRRLSGGTEPGAAYLAAELQRFPRFQELQRTLLQGLARGLAAVELLWEEHPSRGWIVSDWIDHAPEYFAFDAAGQLLLLTPPFRPEGTAVQLAADAARHWSGPRAIVAPERKFLLLRHDPSPRHPYGRALAQHAYWTYFLKKNTLKSWAIHNERHGSPTTVARCSETIHPEDRERLSELLENLQASAGVVVPESVQLGLLEQGRPNAGESFREFVDWCNDELAKLILGATLTSGEGRRSGSLALGQIHQNVRQEYIESDARLLESVLNGQLIRWMAELQRIDPATLPSWRVATEQPTDEEAALRADKALLSLGVRLPISWFTERYGRPVPKPGEESLRFDDANFYQYHLQYGILSVNEVRARLGLAPVPWGDRRTANPDGSFLPEVSAGEDVARPPL